MESSEIFKENTEISNEEIKREIVEDYRNYREISEAISKGNTLIEFIIEKGQHKGECWRIQISEGTKRNGIFLLESSLGEFYVNRDRKKGKIQYLSVKEGERRELRNLTDELCKMKSELKGLINETRKKRRKETRKCYYCNERGHIALNCQKRINDNKNNGKKIKKNQRNNIVCYNCNETGHITPRCPNRNRRNIGDARDNNGNYSQRNNRRNYVRNRNYTECVHNDN